MAEMICCSCFLSPFVVFDGSFSIIRAASSILYFGRSGKLLHDVPVPLAHWSCSTTETAGSGRQMASWNIPHT